MGRTPTGLTEKHYQALKLLEANNLSREEIAAAVGWSYQYFKEICAGDVEKAGTCAVDFKRELQKIIKDRDKKIRELVKENSEDAQTLIKRILGELKTKKRLTDEEKKLVGTLTNCLNKATPSVSIENLSYSYTKGLTAEELVHEFKRLKGVAELSFERRRIQSSIEGGSGEVSGPDEQ